MELIHVLSHNLVYILWERPASESVDLKFRKLPCYHESEIIIHESQPCVSKPNAISLTKRYG